MGLFNWFKFGNENMSAIEFIDKQRQRQHEKEMKQIELSHEEALNESEKYQWKTEVKYTPYRPIKKEVENNYKYVKVAREQYLKQKRRNRSLYEY